MKILGQLEGAQLENLAVAPATPSVGQVYADTSGPSADPRFWTGSAWVSLNPAGVLSFDAISPLTTKGDVLGHDGTNNVRLPIGADTYVLTADSSAATGMSWQPGSGGGSGTVTSIGIAAPLGEFTVVGSPVTVAGVITINANDQVANTVWAGRATAGVPIPPSFRALVPLDIPALDFSKITTGNIPINRGGTGAVTATAAFDALSPLTTKGDLIAHDGTNNVRVPVGANGLVLAANSAQPSGLEWIAVGGTGTVTSVDLTMPAIFSVAGNPITTNGTLAVSLATQNANLVWAGPAAAGPATPTFRALVAADIPNLDTSILTSGTLPVARGGTGITAPGAAGNVLTSDGAGNWISAVNPGGSGVEIDLFTYIGGIAPSDGIDGVRVAEVPKTISKVVCALRNSGTSGSTVVRFFYDATLSSFFDVTIVANGGLAAQVSVPAVSLGVSDFISATILSVAAGAPEDLSCKVYY